ncbi:MAG: Gx transporter family protein [Lachnospiraceae bacterium]|nr:Gx transporter family protein [Lachnospiraceae bacterium]
MQLQGKGKIAYIAVLSTLALIFSYVESLIPLNAFVPGIKLGLANIVSILALYMFGPIYAYIIVIIRTIIAGFLFGNMFSIVYSISGGLLSVFVMVFLKKIDKFSIIGVSIAGGVFHNIGQLIVAMFAVNQLKLYYYGPVLIISGIIMGITIGMLSLVIVKRVETYVRL